MSLRQSNSYESMSQISFGQGRTVKVQKEVESVVFMCDNNPTFDQMFTVRVSEEMKELNGYHLYFSVWNVKEKKRKKDESKGFAFLRMEDVIRSNFKEYVLPLYAQNKKVMNKYLESDSKLIIGDDGSYVKVAIRAGNLELYFNLLVYGYMRMVQQNITYDLLDLVVMFVCV